MEGQSWCAEETRTAGVRGTEFCIYAKSPLKNEDG